MKGPNEPAAGDLLEDETEALVREAAELEELIEPAPLPPRARARLFERVERLPDRYAPFFASLVSLWSLEEAELVRELERARDPGNWRYTPLPGIRVFELRAADAPAGFRSRLVRFAPGITFPRHRHRGEERVLVLEGSYTETGGRVVRSGDLHEMASDTAHGFTVAPGEPCIAAVLESGREFESRILRVLAKLTGED